jgi:hypothetical protein
MQPRSHNDRKDVPGHNWALGKLCKQIHPWEQQHHWLQCPHTYLLESQVPWVDKNPALWHLQYQAFAPW